MQSATANAATSTNGAPRPPIKVTEDEFDRLPVGVLRESPTNPRKHFDQVKLNELAASVKEHGVVEPLITRPLANGTYEVIAGARRLRACMLADLVIVPCIIRHNLTESQILEIQTIENLQREDVHPIEEGDGYKLLLDKAGYTIEKLAEKVSKSASYIYQRLKLAELIKPVQEKFWSGEITAGHAILIARLQPAEQKDAIRECVTKWRTMSVRELGEWIQREVHHALTAAPFDPKSAELVPSAGACVACPKRTGASAVFADITDKDQCTDPACYNAKLQAHIDHSLKSAAQPILRLSSSYTDPPKGVLSSGSYLQIGNGVKKCDAAQVGIVVHGHNGIGKQISVCADPKCKVHRPGGRNVDAGMEKYRREQKAREEKQRRTRQLRHAILDRVLSKAPQVLNAPADLRVVAKATFKHLWSDHQRVLLSRNKLLDGAKAKRDFQEIGEEWIDGMKGDALARMLLEMALIRFIDGLYEKGDLLIETAKRYKLDPEAIERNLQTSAKLAKASD